MLILLRLSLRMSRGGYDLRLAGLGSGWARSPYALVQTAQESASAALARNSCPLVVWWWRKQTPICLSPLTERRAESAVCSDASWSESGRHGSGASRSASPHSSHHEPNPSSSE